MRLHGEGGGYTRTVPGAPSVGFAATSPVKDGGRNLQLLAHIHRPPLRGSRGDRDNMFGRLNSADRGRGAAAR